MADKITYRLAVPSDIPELVNFINSHYIRKKSPDYFRWQYYQSCYPSILMCAFQEKSLIGMFGLQKRKLLNGANTGQAIDLLVAPEWRGKGIFTELGKRATMFFQDLDLVCVFPNLNGKHASEKSLQWNTIGKIDSMVLNLNPEVSFDSYVELHPGAGFHSQLIQFEYTEKIQDWRFDQNPLYKYQRLPEKSKTFVVTKIFVDPVTGRRFGDIVYIECPLEKQELLQGLFAIACEYFRNQKVDSVTTWALPHTFFADVTKSFGFLVMPSERYFCVKVLMPKYEQLYDFSRWHLVQADAEIY
jgi:hypothetical protein